MNIEQGEKKIAVYGGAFDPPHNGHIHVIKTVAKFNIDEIWIFPSGNRSDKQYRTTSTHRVHMIELLLNELSEDVRTNVKLCLAELNSQEDDLGSAYWMNYFKKNHPHYQFFLVIGSDLYQDLATWKNSSTLKKEVNFIGIRRPKTGEPPQGYSIVELESELESSISSSQIRSLLELQKSINRGENCDSVLKSLVPESILNYIIKNNLYV
jgi:nicotinate-nucleotide adenylyltransferase